MENQQEALHKQFSNVKHLLEEILEVNESLSNIYLEGTKNAIHKFGEHVKSLSGAANFKEAANLNQNYMTSAGKNYQELVSKHLKLTQELQTRVSEFFKEHKLTMPDIFQQSLRNFTSQPNSQNFGKDFYRQWSDNLLQMMTSFQPANKTL